MFKKKKEKKKDQLTEDEYKRLATVWNEYLSDSYSCNKVKDNLLYWIQYSRFYNFTSNKIS